MMQVHPKEPIPAVPVPNQSNTLKVAREAFDRFCIGLAKGEWEPFLEMLTDDFTFFFPKGKYAGRNEGKEKAREFFAYVAQVFNNGLVVTLDRVMSNDTTVVFEFRDEGILMGQMYRNRVALSFDVCEDKICGYREYFGMDSGSSS